MDRTMADNRQPQNHENSNRVVPSGSGLLGTRTIGDLVSGEIERTLEISNHSLINSAVDMSVMIRPETVYSPISRPASAEGDTGLATLAHVASYAPSTAVSTPASRSSVLFTPVTQSQRYFFRIFFCCVLNCIMTFLDSMMEGQMMTNQHRRQHFKIEFPPFLFWTVFFGFYFGLDWEAI